jgi:hypothetical protein
MDYDTVAPDIKDHLRKQKQDNAVNQWLDGLKKDAYVVEDGKEVHFTETPEEDNEPSLLSTATPSGTKESSANAPTGSSVTQTAANPTPTPSTTESEKPLYPTLPEGGSFVLELGAEGLSYGVQDIANYYGPSVDAAQNFPFGYGFHGSLDFAIDPSIEIGVKLEILRKFTETVNFSPSNQSAYSELWYAGGFGGGLEAKILLPLDESTNFYLSAMGGYYALQGGALVVTGTSMEGADLLGSNFGGEAGGGIEFFLDGNKDVSLGLQAAYRLLKFQPITTQNTYDNGGPITSFPSILANADGSQTVVDFSGVDVGADVRFYIDK